MKYLLEKNATEFATKWRIFYNKSITYFKQQL